MKNNIIFSIILTVLILASSNMSYAQDSSSNKTIKKFKYGIGGGAGFATGYGLSFRYIPKKFGAQLNFAPYIDNTTSTYSVGATFLYKLNENNTTNVYVYQGNHFYYNSQILEEYDPTNPSVPIKVRSTDSYVNNGVGFGLEIIFVKCVGLNFMAGYAAYKNFQQLNVTGEIALYYKF